MTDETISSSCLNGLRQRDPDQWRRFARVYSPLVYEWCRRARIPAHDSADIVQETFGAVSERIDSFRRDQLGDSFQGWLWGIARHKILDHFRMLAKHPVAAGGSSAQQMLNQLPELLAESPTQNDLAQDRQLVVRRALELLKSDFEDRTWRAFCRLVMENVDAKTVANELGMTPGAVYNAKYKVLRRLREEFSELL
ncbi:MAG: sigma-70 family RNA polymerase sigma factor [Planctomycetales bacterium]|nr:sigma-70 family RNA polymerase sigma factor [Planctomycetales bacterium]